MLRRIPIALLEFYQLYIRKLLPPLCRFTPSCSEYAKEAFKRYGLVVGFFKTGRRVIKCNPWSRAEVYDPVE